MTHPIRRVVSGKTDEKKKGHAAVQKNRECPFFAFFRNTLT
jgi:hypothetical protein